MAFLTVTAISAFAILATLGGYAMKTLMTAFRHRAKTKGPASMVSTHSRASVREVIQGMSARLISTSAVLILVNKGVNVSMGSTPSFAHARKVSVE